MDKQKRQTIIRRVTWIGAWLDGVLAAIKIAVGWLVHSPALIADGFHSLSDLLTDVAVVAFSHWAQADPDEEHPYGHHRYETLGTVILGTTLIVVASVIAWDSLLGLIESTRVASPSFWAIIISVVSIVSKEWIFRFTLRAAKKIKSNLLEANAWHSRSDAFSSIVVLIGVVATWFGYGWVELIAAMAVAGLIGKMGVSLTWNASQELMDRGMEPEEIKVIEQTIQATPGVVDVHMLRSRMMGNHVYLDVHIQVDGMLSVSEGHYIAEKVMGRIRKEHHQVADMTVHVDPEDDLSDDESVGELPDRQTITSALADIDVNPTRLHIHYLTQRVSLELIYDSPPANLNELKTALEEWSKKQPWLANSTIVVVG